MPFIEITPPVRTPHRYGLFSIATVIEETDPHVLSGARWAPEPCEHPGVYPGPCSAVPPPEDGKCTTCQPEPVEALPFTVYGSWECLLAGFTPQEAAQRAQRHLTNGEQHAVEYALWTGNVGNTPHLADPTAVNIGTAECAQDLFARIYAYADQALTGEPVIHAPRAVMPWLACDGGQLVRNGGRLETQLGTPIAFGSGYTEANTGPDGTVAPAGSYWVYVTGPVFIRRSPIIAVPDPAEAGFNRTTNVFTALAERTYIAGFDCLLAAILFTPSC